MIRYYYTGLGGEYNYFLNDSQKIIYKHILDNEKANISITYNSININTGIEPQVVKREDIYFYIYAFLFKKEKTIEEQINTTSILTERKYLFKTNTTHYYNYYNPEKFNITFDNFPRNYADIYELQLQVNAIIQNNIFNEEFLIFTSEIDLTDIKYIHPEEKKNYTGWIIGGVIGGVIIIGLVIFFILKYKRLQKSNTNLREDLKSMAFSNDVQKNVLIKERRNSKKETDYESTFI